MAAASEGLAASTAAAAAEAAAASASAAAAISQRCDAAAAAAAAGATNGGSSSSAARRDGSGGEHSRATHGGVRSSPSVAGPAAPPAAEPIKAFIGGISWHLDDEGLRKREFFPRSIPHGPFL